MICVIVARAGSKRLPHKNSRSLHGRPLFLYTLQAAITSEVFSEIILSSDDETIKTLTQEIHPNVVIHHRDAKLADDKSTVIDVIKSLALEKSWQEDTDICVLSPCTPFRSSMHIQQAYQKYSNSQYMSLGSVQKVRIPGKFHRILKEDGTLSIIQGEITGSIRPAEHVQEYLPTGAIMMIRLQKLVQENNFYPNGVIPIELEWPANHDIDTIEDWNIAEMICQILDLQKVAQS